MFNHIRASEFRVFILFILVISAASVEATQKKSAKKNLASVPASASQSVSSLSKHDGHWYRLRWISSAKTLAHPFPMVGGDILNIHLNDQKFKAFATRVKVEGATFSGVRREWAFAQKLAKGKVVASNCTRPTPFFYTCEKILHQSKGYEVTKMAWDSEGFKTLIRVDGIKDEKMALELKGLFTFEGSK